MQSQRINITLPNDLVRDLRRSVTDGSRSKFIAEAVKAKLTKKRDLRKELVKSLKAFKKLYKEIKQDWGPLEVEGWPD
ncbi:hypothetical protein HYW46_00760 [Candidatus Daviesbacteria bacterium]|nr:hypothetical protein [Candidatus Daviesbacteria bacterium]